jgi:hypothetical protein
MTKLREMPNFRESKLVDSNKEGLATTLE